MVVGVDFCPDSIDRSTCRKAESVNLLPIVYNDDSRNFVTHGVNELASTILGHLIRTDNFHIKSIGSISAGVPDPSAVSAK